jgi:hypothetical protein
MADSSDRSFELYPLNQNRAVRRRSDYVVDVLAFKLYLREEQKLSYSTTKQYTYYTVRMLQGLGVRGPVHPSTTSMQSLAELYRTLVVSIPVNLWSTTRTAWRRFCNWYFVEHGEEIPLIPFKKPASLSLVEVDGWVNLRKQTLDGGHAPYGKR